MSEEKIFLIHLNNVDDYKDPGEYFAIKTNLTSEQISKILSDKTNEALGRNDDDGIGWMNYAIEKLCELKEVILIETEFIIVNV